MSEKSPFSEAMEIVKKRDKRIAELQAEVERLRDKNAKDRLDADAVAYLAECEDRAEKAEAEAERLRETCVTAADYIEGTGHCEGIRMLRAAGRGEGKE